MSGWLADPRAKNLDIDDPQFLEVRRRVVQEKAFLRAIYDEWYSKIISALPAVGGQVLELGAGGGFLAERLPGVITSELLVTPSVRLVLDAQKLPLADASLRAIVMTDVLHHLPQSPLFLRDAARCVRPGGRVVMIEPWVTPWSAFIYRRFHHEPFRPDARTWEFERGGPLSAANMALPWIIFVRDRARFEREFPEWRVLRIEPIMPFRYLASGGVSARALSPAWTFSWWRAFERLLTPWMPRLGLFAHIVLERAPAGPTHE